MKTLALCLVAALGTSATFASGFGLYEASTKGHALGGAVLGRAVDASANFYNPATLSDLTNVTITTGFVTQHPRAKMKVEGGGASTKMDPGAFLLPHFGLAIPLPADFTFGLMAMPEYGLGSEFAKNWELVNSSQKTTVESFTLTPNLAYAITKDWSIAAGARILFFDFEQYSQPMNGLIHRLKGDNGMQDVGWQVATRYRLRDDFAVGLIYKSRTTVNVEGSSQMRGAMYSYDPAKTELEMPDSVTGGFNWDITESVHLGAAVMWTQWSTIKTLDFELGSRHVPCVLEWEDTYRFTLAPSWDFAEDWQLMGSYAYETDCCGEQLSTMLPASERHMLTAGVAWKCLEGLEIALSYGVILMDGRDSQAEDSNRNIREYRPHRGISHAVGLSFCYQF